MYKIVLLRHGQSTWNNENRFTGWTDVSLTEQGRNEAKNAAQSLLKDGFRFDIAFTSLLARATETLDIVLEEMKLKDIPIVNSWKLNERHYGALQGLNKAEMAKKMGEKQVLIWRRSYDIPPPALEKQDERHPGNDPKYKGLPQDVLPSTECLKDTVARVLPYWKSEIVPVIKQGKSIIIAAHGNSLRALVKYLDKVPNDEIIKLNIPTGIPLVYELNEDLSVIKHYYLGDKAEIEKAISSVANQGKAK